MKVKPTNMVVVIMVSTTGEKTPMETITPSITNTRNPAEANPIFISFVFLSESNEIILISVDSPRNENRKNISNSFIC